MTTRERLLRRQAAIRQPQHGDGSELLFDLGGTVSDTGQNAQLDVDAFSAQGLGQTTLCLLGTLRCDLGVVRVLEENESGENVYVGS